MKILENPINTPEDNEDESEDQLIMSEAWKRVAADIENNGQRLFGYERKKGQTHVSYIQNLRRAILEMGQQELELFEDEYLPNLSSTRNKDVPHHRKMTPMELDALNSAIEERRESFLQKENKPSYLESLSENELIEEAGDIFDKVKLPNGANRVNFIKEFLLHKSEIQASRQKVEKLFAKIVGEKAVKTLNSELQEGIDWPALGKNPSAVLKYVKNLLEKSGRPFESLSQDEQIELRNAVGGTSAFAVDFKSMNPAVEAIKKLEEGGYLNIEGEYIGRGGAKNPYVDLSSQDIEHLKTNFDQITDLSLHKIAAYINEPLSQDAAPEEKDEKAKQIKKGIKSICNQLGQERWWWARHLDEEQIDSYKDKLLELDDELIDQIKEQMIADDIKIKLPSHRAIYNRLFGSYNEAFKKALRLEGSLEATEAA